MDVVDIVLVVLVVASAIHGLRLGALVQILTFAGFFVGMLIGAFISVAVVGSTHNQTLRSVVSLVLVFGLAIALGGGGRVLGTWSNAALRRHHLAPIDSAAGVGVAVVAVLISAWLVASVVAQSQYYWLNSAVQRSDILRTVDDIMPEPPQILDRIGSFLSTAGFPLVFDGLAPPLAPPVSIPDSVQAQAIAAPAEASTVKVLGNACGYQQEGSAFVVAPGLVVTNAHVVAGESSTSVVVDGQVYGATVVHYDPNYDLALIRTTAPLGPPLRLATSDVSRGTTGAVLGYPEDRGLTVGSAGVDSQFNAAGPNIYDSGRVVRDIYQVDATVLPGNSGGPLLAANGQVVGMIFSRSTEYANVGYALTSPGILSEVNQFKGHSAPVGTGGCAAD